ncbi:MAG: hypothetical protein WB676_27920 [Bryobacteraceae bacterium]
MNKSRCLVAGITFFLLGWPIRAEISTVFLAQPSKKGSQPTNKERLTIAQQEGLATTATLSFNSVPPLPAPSVKSCMLGVVPVVDSTKLGANQDVVVKRKGEQVGHWSISGYKTKPYLDVPLKTIACSAGRQDLTLETNSPKTKWEYNGPDAPILAARPRLFVTYSDPAPARSGDATEWRYREASSFWFRGLWQVPTNVTVLTNPTPYNGAVYFVAGSSESPKLYRVALGENPRSWELKDKKVTSNSFTFITGSGRLRVVTLDAIYSCDLNVLQQPNKYDDTQACRTEESPKTLTVNSNEPPAMGTDGTLYFKNVEGGGSVVAFNPSAQELWRTDLHFETVSPISLDASGRYVYLLGQIQVNKKKKAGLFVIDTVSGQTFHKFIYGDQDIEPDMATLWKPAVVTKVKQKKSVDYVFVAGNTNDDGVLQLVRFDGERLAVEWDKFGKIAAPPVVSVDGNSVVVASASGESPITRYEWYRADPDPNKTGVFAKADLKGRVLASNYKASRIFVDGGGLVYVNANKNWYVYDASAASPNKPRAFMQVERAALDSQFTEDGRLILWTGSSLDTIIPKSHLKEVPKELVSGTIYSADEVGPEVSSGSKVKSGDRVILRGTQVTFPENFDWPLGATLTVQVIP